MELEFDIEKFRVIYPQFSEIPDETLTFYWNNALMISGLANDTRFTDAEREALLFLLTCHLATLAGRGTSGPMASATQGSVSVSFATLGAGTSGEWYLSTPCGAAYWQAIRALHTGGLWFCGCHGKRRR